MLIRRLMLGLLMLMFILCSHGATQMLWLAETPPSRVSQSFLGIGVTLVDLALLIFCMAAMLLLYFNDNFHAEIERISIRIITKFGGIWWILLMVWILISSVWAREGILSRYNALHMLFELMAAVGVAYFVSKEQEKPLLYAFLAMAVFQSIVAMLQLLHGQSLGLSWLLERQLNPNSTFGFGDFGFRGIGLEGHPNILAGSLYLAICVCMLLWKNHWVKAASVVIGLGVIATLSRTMLAITIISILLHLILQGNIPRKTWLKGAGVLLGIIGLAALIFGARFWGNLQERTLVLLEHPSLLLDRLVYSQGDSNAVWRDSPILGVGADNLMIEIAYLRGRFPDLLQPVHNVYLYILVELGVFGLLFFLMGMSNHWSKLRPSNLIEVRLLSIVFVGISIIILVDFFAWDRLRWRLLMFLFMGLFWGYQLRSSANSA